NSVDGVASRDWLVEAVGAAANASTSMSRLAEDVVIWSTHEFGFVELDDRYSSSSSIMPQKKNPDTAELVRGRAAETQALHQALLANTKGLPMAYNRDLQAASPPAFRAMKHARESVAVLRGVLETASYDVDAMQRTVERGFTGATELADVLVREYDLSFREAHHAVATVARSGGRVTADAVESALRDVVDEKIDVEAEDVEEALDASVSVARHDSYGGPGEIDTAIEDVADEIEKHESRVADLESELNEARRALDEAIEEVS
ncbi:MAG: lyase family protein, partial [Halobacteriota archaeon]